MSGVCDGGVTRTLGDAIGDADRFGCAPEQGIRYTSTIPRFDFPSARALLRALAGLVGGVTLSVALGAPAGSGSLAEAPVAGRAVASASLVLPARTDATAWNLGRVRVQEAEEALASRREAITAASRSSERPALQWPARGALSGWYGESRGGRGHAGLDIDGSTGDPVFSAGEGVVEWAGRAPAGYSGYGLMVIIRHSGGVRTLYAHLSRVATATGAVVEAGDPVGAIGTTGSVTGSHLHFEVRLADTPVDPRAWLPGR